MSIKRFEDLKVWMKARELANLIYNFTKAKEFSQDRALARQIQRSSVSVMANIAEGFERGGNKEFIQFIFIAKSSIAETKSHLYIAYDQGYISEKELKKALEMADEDSRMIAGLIKHLQKN